MQSPPRDLSASLRRIADILAEGGLRHLLIRLLQRLSSPLVECGSVMFLMRGLDQDLPEPEIPPPLTLREASPSDLPLLLGACDPSRSSEMLLARFRRGDFCFVAMDADGMVVHSCWATTGPGRIPELAMEVLPAPREVYLYDGYTRPDVRHRGIFALAFHFMLTSLRAAGFNRVCCYVRSDNLLSLRVVQRWLRSTGRVWYLRLGRFRPLVLGWHSLHLPHLTRIAARDAGAF